MQQHGDAVAGRKIEIILRDDSGVADNARRLIQEMIVNDKVDVCGIGITPCAGRSPRRDRGEESDARHELGASITTTKSPYFVRAGFLLSQQSWILAEWAAKNGSKRVVHIGQRMGARRRSRDRIQDALYPSWRRDLGIDPHFRLPIPTSRRSCSALPTSSRTPPSSTSPAPRRPIFAKQFAERGLAKSGIKIIGPAT